MSNINGAKKNIYIISKEKMTNNMLCIQVK